jgi:thiamine phosphate synthase YjbQ (UPF0047 family)
VPIVAGEMTLGTWQQVMLLEPDTRARRREAVIQVMSAWTRTLRLLRS